MPNKVTNAHSLNTLEKFERIQQEEPLYLRFGPMPKSGHSHNARARLPLPGVCVFEGEYIFWDSDYAEYEILYGGNMLLTYLLIRTPAYLLTGKVVGRDPELGTPLLKPAKWWRLPSNVDLRVSGFHPQLVAAARDWNESERKQLSLRELKRRYKWAKWAFRARDEFERAPGMRNSVNAWPSTEGAAAPSPLQRHSTVRKIGRNEPCPCGSGKKFKKCCGA